MIGAGTLRRSMVEEQEYHRFFMALLRWKPMSLCLLVDANQSNSTGFPTWVPRWNRPGCTAWISEKCIYETTQGGIYSCVKRHGLPLLNVDNMTLSVFGCFLDQVTCAIDVLKMDTPNADFGLVVAFLEWMSRAQLLVDSQFLSSGEEFENVLKQLLPVGIQDPPMSNNITKPLKAWLGIIFGYANEYLPPRKYSEQTTPHSDHVFRIFDQIRQVPDALACHQALVEHMCGKIALFVTKQGRIGAGSIGIKDNDTIHRISGVPLPMVLRKEGFAREYQVVGPARIRDEKHQHIWRYKFRRMDLV
ncbi:uncharacterized protein BDZ99DRAFT_478863 [Mytilinidion resinicola]|uniref:Heterokaryon incompatibility domain-containing protein n=1 Tax=Mytilinidion resinicola TaxID=574789 RepID=A0A6A6YEX0_9PEZI|nr:uncharacterized protein BDZ99DRAFT_478863 [Mytilinidion resinicola]KAF2807376.1 hypothetical protein BDZ99DRAFT_478863 [Mytilinidion resinicola]